MNPVSAAGGRVSRPSRVNLRILTASDLHALLPGLVLVGLILVWSAHNGGFDADTWYWGALVALAVLAVVACISRFSGRAIPRTTLLAIGLFGLYVSWSFLSITWAQAQGVALEGSNRALLYLIVFTAFAVLPWSRRSALVALLVYALGIGVIAVVTLVGMASTGSGASAITEGRLVPPAGYFNANAALFTIGALVMIGLATRRELPGLLRGLLIAMASAGLQLSVVAQSRGWLFTIPIVIVIALILIANRLRFIGFAVLPVAGALIPVHKLLRIYGSSPGEPLTHAVHAAARTGLVVVCGVFILATILAWTDKLAGPARLSRATTRAIGIVVTAVVILAFGAGAFAATHGHPFRYVSRQWNGFSHPQSFNKGSHFSDVGSGRYDFWRVSVDAFAAHPIGGLGQDNFVDYYLPRRRTTEEPDWTHSLELRLLAHTGAVGFGLFAAFLAAALASALRVRRRGDLDTRALAGIALLPLVVWLVHGSIDWFWELPALSGPALGFLGLAGVVAQRPASGERPSGHPAAGHGRVGRVLGAAAATLVLVAATLVLTFPYLSVREVSMATDLASSNPPAALHDLQVAADLNPLNADAGTRAGLLALSDGQNAIARRRFAQAIDREPGAWLPWLGAGLADSALGARPAAARALRHAYSINNQQPPIKVGLQRVFSAHPLTYTEAVPLFVIAR